MKKEYDEYLCRTYPKLYAQRHMSMQQTCMCWGFDVGDGWFNIINGLSMAIQSHIAHNTRERWRCRKEKRKFNAMTREEQLKNDWMARVIPERVHQVVVTQVKEKFGTLRFYYNGGDDAIRNYVQMAECMTYVTCENCGAPGKIGGQGWISVKCSKCSGDDIDEFDMPEPAISEEDLPE